MQDFLEILFLAYKKLSAQNIILVLLLIKIVFCGIGGVVVTYFHSKFSYKWLRNNFNIYVGITLPVIGLVITTVIGSNIALSGKVPFFLWISNSPAIFPGIAVDPLPI